jgi:hypothetical protein
MQPASARREIRHARSLNVGASFQLVALMASPRSVKGARTPRIAAPPVTPRLVPIMRLLPCSLLLSALLFPATQVLAQAAAAPGAAPAAKPAAKPKAVSPPKAATSREQLKNQAKGLALATEVVEQISEGQLQAASRVMTGDIDCEFDQKITLKPVEGQPGHFHLGFKKITYRMVPEETTTGAVRLEDKRAGVVWLQIPMKSMLMNSKIGQRMVDACLHADQRAAIAAAAAAQAEAAAMPASMQGSAPEAVPATGATGLGIAPNN